MLIRCAWHSGRVERHYTRLHRVRVSVIAHRLVLARCLPRTVQTLGRANRVQVLIDSCSGDSDMLSLTLSTNYVLVH